MIISDLNPIQFWPVAKQTFNEKIEPGIDRAKYIYSPFLHDVQLLQVLSVDPVWMVAYGINLNPINILPFVETSGGSGVWNLQFTSVNISGTCVYFKIGTIANFIANPSFITALNPWFDSGGIDEAWVWDSSAAAKITFSSSSSNLLAQIFSIKPAGVYYYSFTCKNSIAVRSTTITIQTYNGATLADTITIVGETSAVDHVHSGLFFTSTAFDRIIILVYDIFSANDYIFILSDFSLFSFTPIFKSDLIYFTDDVFGTQLLQYSNANDYAGISYAAAEKFCKRIPAKFYEEREPEEDESEALSDSTIVKLAGTVKRQKFLEIEPLPPYEILKIKLILKHNSLKVDDDYCIQEESMNVSKLNDRFALFISKVWLTLRDNGYFTNVYGASVSLDQTSGLPDPMSDFTSGVTYFGETELAHAETFLGGTIDEGGETYIGIPSSQHAELVFADSAQESELTYIGDPNNNNPGWGCILNPCGFRPDGSRILWDDGDDLRWDDGDNIDVQP